MTNDNQSRVLRLREVQERVPFSRAQIWRLEREGIFPARIHLSANRVGWLETEIDDWIIERLAQREQD